MKNQNVEDQIEIERTNYDEFLGAWSQGKFEEQRLGQAFYNHFRLHKLNDQASLQNLYETDGEKALETISRCFLIR